MIGDSPQSKNEFWWERNTISICVLFVLKRHNSSEDDDDDAWWLWEPKGSHFSMPYDNANAFPFLQFQFKVEVQTKFGHVLFVLIQII